MSGVRIELESGSVTAGEVLRGRLILGGEVRRPGLSLTLSFQYRTEGRGDPDEGATAGIRLLGDATSPPAELPFAVAAPASPWSYEGKLVKIRWIMRIQAEIQGFSQYFDAPVVLLSPFLAGDHRGYRA